MVQIHIEKVYDLLDQGPHGAHPAPLPLREDKTQGVYVQGAHVAEAKSIDEALGLIKQASTRLTFASTKMNLHSSRSHSVCELRITKSTTKQHRKSLVSPGPATRFAGIAQQATTAAAPLRLLLLLLPRRAAPCLARAAVPSTYPHPFPASPPSRAAVGLPKVWRRRPRLHRR